MRVKSSFPEEEEMKSLSRVMKAKQISVGEPLTIEHIKKQAQKQQQQSQKSAKQLSQEMLEQTEQQVEQMIESAKEQAQQIMDESIKQVEQLKISTLQKAKEEGYQEIMREADDLLKEARQKHQQAQEKYQTAIREAEKDIITMVLDIARTVLGDEIETRQQAIVSLVSRALRQCKGAEAVTVRVSPEAYETAMANKEDIAKNASFSGEITLKKDVSLPHDGCVVETPVGNIDASVHVQLKEIEKAFMEAFQKDSYI